MGKKYIHSTGCLAFSTTVDGKEAVDMTADELRDNVTELEPMVTDRRSLEQLCEFAAEPGEDCEDYDKWWDDFYDTVGGFTEERLRDVIREGIKNADDTAVLQEMLEICIDSLGTYESDGIPCECCGDIVETYTLEIK